ncbi:hypothetical protein KDI_31690 [Dictyobacter arantiisoli]|uniref:Helicase ATP-binding domain-containing protein n=2 Tax=Dictyobacter arantiisoli TaxID=2014874 RepID=A0A5A5TEE3_9CHLR|nr:hypothetical protein KDI_31690 [Dictyobacter arantiisoli]
MLGSDTHLLPLRIITVKELDATNLAHAMKRRNISIRFRVGPIGRFESALIPMLKPDGTGKGFILVLDEDLSPADQVALFGHAVAHLIRNHRDQATGQKLTLDPNNDAVHIDKVDELRYFDLAHTHDRINRNVIETCPRLHQLFETPEEGPIVQAQVRQKLDDLLRKKGWTGFYVRQTHLYTDGRVLPDPNGRTRRGKRQSIDALLRIELSLPTAALHVQRSDETEATALRRVREAGQKLSVPFGYMVTEKREILEYDWTTGSDADVTLRAELPDRSELTERWFKALQLTEKKERDALTHTFYMQDKQPRYYQEAAINRAIIATMQARRGLRPKRILLTLATGTGKTQIAFQILWKLRQSHNTRRILFLADRSYLLDQAQFNAFGPFTDALARGTGKIDIVHDVLFASYQWLTTNNAVTGQPNYLDYPSDYFDIIVIDECHRGSADEDSNWRKVLLHFSEAIQIGLTATPLATRDVQTNAYFGASIYTYSLSQGINDGYLAPYRVHRIQIGKQVAKPAPEQDQKDNPSATQVTQATQATQNFIGVVPEAPEQDGKPQEEVAPEIVTETAQAMREYTTVIADHLANYLRQTDTQAKTIIFCVDNNHANQMRLALETACADFARAGDIVRIVDDDGNDGKLDLNNFCIPKERQPVIVTTSRLLSTGVDVPTCKNIVLARGVGSIVEFKQIIGRGTRLYTTATPAKNWFTILDYSGAIKHFFDRDFDGDPEAIQNEQLIIKTPTSTAENTEQAEPGEQPGTETKREADPSERVADTATDSPATQQEEDNHNTVVTPGAESDAEEPASHPGQNNTPEQEAGSPQDSQQENSGAPATNTIDEQTEQTGVEGTGKGNPAEEGARADDLAASIQASRSEGQSAVSERKKPRQVKEQPSAKFTGPQEATAEQAETLAKAEKQGRAHRLGKKSDGTVYEIVNDVIYELGPDNHLRLGSMHDFAQQALRGYISTPEDFRLLWLTKEGQKEIKEQLEGELVTTDALAAALKKDDVDVLDLLLYVVFDIEPLTRVQRVERLRQRHQDFFQRFAQPPLASQVLNAILDKYILGEAPDVSKPALLSLPPLTKLGMPMDLSRAFSTGPERKNVSEVLRELRSLLYSV